MSRVHAPFTQWNNRNSDLIFRSLGTMNNFMGRRSRYAFQVKIQLHELKKLGVGLVRHSGSNGDACPAINWTRNRKMVLNHWSFTQLCNFLQLQAEQIRGMTAKNATSKILSALCSARDEAVVISGYRDADYEPNISTVIGINHANREFSVNSDVTASLTRFSEFGFIAPAAKYGTQHPSHEQTSFHFNDRMIAVHLVHEDLSEIRVPVDGKELIASRGLIIENSDVGLRPLAVSPILYLPSVNGCLVGSLGAPREGDMFSIFQVDLPEALLMIQDYLEKSESYFRDLLLSMYMKKVADDEGGVIQVLDRYSIKRNVIDATFATAKFLGKDITNLYELVECLTYTQKAISRIDRRNVALRNFRKMVVGELVKPMRNVK